MPIEQIKNIIKFGSGSYVVTLPKAWLRYYKLDEKDPVYCVFNLCRILAFLKDRVITSKKEAGEWALTRLPKEFSSIINAALDSYTSDSNYASTDMHSFKDFVAYAKNEIDTLKQYYLE